MTAELHTLSGLHGHGLVAFKAAGEIVSAHMNEQAEGLLRDMRKLLGFADQLFRLDPLNSDFLEVADSFVACASNRLAASIRLSERAA